MFYIYQTEYVSRNNVHCISPYSSSSSSNVNRRYHKIIFNYVQMILSLFNYTTCGLDRFEAFQIGRRVEESAPHRYADCLLSFF
jgi:hypothetical protein